jgi:hypothetical protein
MLYRKLIKNIMILARVWIENPDTMHIKGCWNNQYHNDYTTRMTKKIIFIVQWACSSYVICYFKLRTLKCIGIDVHLTHFNYREYSRTFCTVVSYNKTSHSFIWITPCCYETVLLKEAIAKLIYWYVWFISWEVIFYEVSIRKRLRRIYFTSDEIQLEV